MINVPNYLFFFKLHITVEKLLHFREAYIKDQNKHFYQTELILSKM